MSAIDTMRVLPLFADVRPYHLGQLAAAASLRPVAIRSQLVARGDAVTATILLVRGILELSFITEDGEPSTLGFVGPGLVGGDAALLDRGEWAVTLTAATDCVCLWIDGGVFIRTMRDSAPLAFNVAVALARRLRMMFRRNELITTMSAPARLARFLVWTDQQRCAAQVAELPLTQEQLGQLVGVSRETVNKHLRRWTAAGWIRARGRGLEVIDGEALLSEDSRPE
jgi:CRP-like cAMP-binding protein